MITNNLPYAKDGVKSNEPSLNTTNLYRRPEKCESTETVLFNKKMTNLIYCPITATGKYVIPGTVTTIGIEAFSRCKGLSSIIMPSSIKSIGCLAFENCIGLTSIMIPQSVEEIGYRVFSNCIGLRSIYVQMESPLNFTEDSEIFYRVDKNVCVLYVPQGTKRKYQRADQWKEFKNIVEMKSNFLASSNN